MGNRCKQADHCVGTLLLQGDVPAHALLGSSCHRAQKMAAYLPGTSDPTLAEEIEVQRQEDSIDALVREVEKTGDKQEHHAATLSASTDMLAKVGLEPVAPGKEVAPASSSGGVSVAAASSPVECLTGRGEATTAQESLAQLEPADEAAIQEELDIFMQLYEKVSVSS